MRGRQRNHESGLLSWICSNEARDDTRVADAASGGIRVVDSEVSHSPGVAAQESVGSRLAACAATDATSYACVVLIQNIRKDRVSFDGVAAENESCILCTATPKSAVGGCFGGAVE
jgi:hypothetical protein